MAKAKLGPFPSLGKIPNGALLAGLAIVGILLYLRGKSTAPTSTTATSVVNSPNNPGAAVTSMGHIVDQGLPANQQSPNEPGTAPIINNQYGGSQSTNKPRLVPSTIKNL